jgi:hypothetical protein
MQAVAQITDEIDRGRPRWDWVYGRAGRALLTLSAIATVSLIIYIVAVHMGELSISEAIRTRQYLLLGLTAAYALLLLLIIPLVTMLGFGLAVIQRILPPVEILAAGQSPSAIRAMGYVFGIIVVPSVLAIILAYAL